MVGASAAEPSGATTSTAAVLESSSAMCQLSRSMPPTSGGRLRVTIKMRNRYNSAILLWALPQKLHAELAQCLVLADQNQVFDFCLSGEYAVEWVAVRLPVGAGKHRMRVADG